MIICHLICHFHCPFVIWPPPPLDWPAGMRRDIRYAATSRFGTLLTWLTFPSPSSLSPQIFGDYYHFQHRKVAKRSAEPGTLHNDMLNNDPEVNRLFFFCNFWLDCNFWFYFFKKVRWVQQQVVKKRVKRDFLESSSRQERSRSDRRPSRRAGTIRSVNYNLNDPRWTQMWYLVRLAIPLVYISCTGAQYWRLDQDGRVKSHGELLIVDSLLAAAHHHSCPHFFDCSFSGESGEWKEQGPRAYLHIIKSDTRQSIESMGFKWFGNFVDVFIPRSFGAAASSYRATQTISTRVFLLYFFFFLLYDGVVSIRLLG